MCDRQSKVIIPIDDAFFNLVILTLKFIVQIIKTA